MQLIQIAQHADDLDRATDFYTVLLDEPPVARFEDPDLAFFELDGARLLLDTSAPSALIYLRVENVHEALERLSGIVDVLSEPHLIFTHETELLGPAGHEEWQAFIRDTEGNTVGLVAFQRL